MEIQLALKAFKAARNRLPCAATLRRRDDLVKEPMRFLGMER